MSRWSTNPKEARHVSDTLIKATLSAGQAVGVMMSDESILKGKIYKMEIHGDHDSGATRGHVILESEDRTEETIDALDIIHLQPLKFYP